MKISRILLYLTLAILGILVSIPIIFTFLISFKTITEIYQNIWSFPSGLYLGNYIEVSEIMASPLMNSFIITIPATLLTVFLGSLGAYGLSKFDFRLKPIYYYIMVSATLIPAHTILAPIFQLWNSLNLIDTYLGLILIEAIFSTAYAVIILRSFFERIPRELLDAARVEGCSDISLYWKIILPLSIPALISAFVIEFVYIWNDFLWPLILAPSTGVQPMTLAILRMAGTHAVAWNLRAAAAIVASLPPLILFVVLQKYFIRGILGGAVIKK